MRAREFVTEENQDLKHPEHNLLDVLDTLRNQFSDAREEPKIRLDSLINMVRAIPGSEMFNVDSLMSVYKDNTAVKNLVTGVKDDGTGVKYVYIKPALGDLRTADIDISNERFGATGSDEFRPEPEQTVGKMAKRAAKKRS